MWCVSIILLTVCCPFQPRNKIESEKSSKVKESLQKQENTRRPLFIICVAQLTDNHLRVSFAENLVLHPEFRSNCGACMQCCWINTKLNNFVAYWGQVHYFLQLIKQTKGGIIQILCTRAGKILDGLIWAGNKSSVHPKDLALPSVLKSIKTISFDQDKTVFKHIEMIGHSRFRNGYSLWTPLETLLNDQARFRKSHFYILVVEVSSPKCENPGQSPVLTTTTNGNS